MAIWKIVLMLVLVGAVMGFFLSTFLVVLLTVTSVSAFFILWLSGRNAHGDAGMATGLIMAAILTLIVPMAITATVVRAAGLSSMVTAPSDTPEGWFQSHLLR